METVDIGCGSSKQPGSVGVDIHPFPGVDVVADLDVTPWPLEADRFDEVICRHVIEHISDPAAFLHEIHRICKAGAQVIIETPHYSSRDSWADPTHRWHYATNWYEPLLAGRYLGDRVGTYEHVSSHVGFGKSLRSLIPWTMSRLFSVYIWEKHYAFIYPARNIRTVLRVCK